VGISLTGGCPGFDLYTGNQSGDISVRSGWMNATGFGSSNSVGIDYEPIRSDSGLNRNKASPRLGSGLLARDSGSRFDNVYCEPSGIR